MSAPQEIRFQCQTGCTKCCEQPGFVYLTEEDHLRIARYLGMTARAFQKRYLYRTRNLRRLRIPRRARCIFLDESGCRIHAVKPLQCRTFPFWPGLMDNKAEWRSTGEWCPGIDRGELVDIESAAEQAAEMLTAHPHLYK